MIDVLTAEQRRLNMSRIRGKDTKPELIVRRTLHRLGFRFRLHRKELPGTPDLVFPSRMCVIFVNGCFWHSHSCRLGTVKPATRSDFWSNKRALTVARDTRNRADLTAQGWRVHTVWECELNDLDKMMRAAVDFLDPAK